MSLCDRVIIMHTKLLLALFTQEVCVETCFKPFVLQSLSLI
jgi:hypothetical protein